MELFVLHLVLVEIIITHKHNSVKPAYKTALGVQLQ